MTNPQREPAVDLTEHERLSEETIRLRRQHLRLRNSSSVDTQFMVRHSTELRRHIRNLRDHLGRRLSAAIELSRRLEE